MSNELSISWSVGDLVGSSYTPQQFIDELPSILTVTADDVSNTYVIGGGTPSSNLGPWMRILPDGSGRWFTWQDGTYKPSPDDNMIRRVMIQPDEPAIGNVASEEPADFQGLIAGDGWSVVDGDSVDVLKYYDGSAWFDMSETAAERLSFSTTYESIDETIEAEVESKIEGYQNQLTTIQSTIGSSTVIVGEKGDQGPQGDKGPQGPSGTIDDSQVADWSDGVARYNAATLLVTDALNGVSSLGGFDKSQIDDQTSQVVSIKTKFSVGFIRHITQFITIETKLSQLRDQIDILVDDTGDTGGLYEELRDAMYPIGTIVKFLALDGGQSYGPPPSHPLVIAGMTFELITDRALLADNSNTESAINPYPPVIGGTGISFSTVAGDTGGSATVTLTAAQTGIPSHQHTFNRNGAEEDNNLGVGSARVGSGDDPSKYPSQDAVSTTSESSGADASEAHNNMPPYYGVYIYHRTA